MMWSLPIAVLLVSMASLSSVQTPLEVDNEIQLPEIAVTDTAKLIDRISDASSSGTAIEVMRTDPAVTETFDSQDEISETHKGDAAGHERAATDAVTPKGGEAVNDNVVPAKSSLSSEETEKPLSLDELLRQVRNTPHLQHEAMIARLAERRRLALAVRSTLEAAKQIADFGLAGTQLLNDASLDKVVATMIDSQETERSVLAGARVDSGSTLPVSPLPSNDTDASMAEGRDESGIEEWRPVYIVKDSRGHRIGWRNSANDDRAIVYVGEQWRIGSDTVVVVAVANDPGRHLVIEVNGERREVHLF